MQNEQILAELSERAESLSARHSEAVAELESARAAQQAILLKGDLSDAKAGKAAGERVSRAANELAGLDAALATIATQRADVERRIASERDRIGRENAAKDLARIVDAIEAQIPAWMDATRRLGADLEKLGAMRFDAGAISRYLSNARSELELAFAVCMPDLRGACAAIHEGREKIPRTAPEPAPIRAVTPAPAPTQQRLFALRHLCWADPTSAHLIMLGQKFTVCQMPPSAAQRALAYGAACGLDDPRCQKLNGSWPHKPRSSADCLDLDADAGAAPSAKPAPGAGEPVRHSAFEQIDRGPAYLVNVPHEVAS